MTREETDEPEDWAKYGMSGMSVKKQSRPRRQPRAAHRNEAKTGVLASDYNTTEGNKKQCLTSISPPSLRTS